MKKITLLLGLVFVLLYYTYQSNTLHLILPDSQAVSETPENQPSIPILMYHKVSPDLNAGGLGLRVTPRSFETQMKLLAKLGYQTISLDRLLAYLKNNRELPNNNKVVIISFDDGYRDNFLWARPVLKKYDFSAVIFLVSNQIGQTNAWDMGRGQPINYLLSLEEINIMLAEGFEFGSHSRNHQILTNLNVSEAKKEIKESKLELENQLGVQIKYFCFPYGRYNQSVVDAVKASGYSAALSTAQGKVSKQDNIFTLRRIRITGYITPEDFLQLINGDGRLKSNKKT